MSLRSRLDRVEEVLGRSGPINGPDHRAIGRAIMADAELLEASLAFSDFVQARAFAGAEDCPDVNVEPEAWKAWLTAQLEADPSGVQLVERLASFALPSSMESNT